jgi:Outer membrane protein beta-barrel domain
MRKLTLTLFAVLCAASLSPAAGKITFGVKAGMLSANMLTASTDVAWSAKWGITGGAFVSFALSDMFAIQPEVLYSPKGAQYSVTDGTTTITATVFAPYIDVPLLLKVFLPTGSSEGVRPVVFAGPYIGFKAGTGKLKTDIVYSGQHDTSEETLTNLKSTDFGVVLGAGAEFPLDTMKILLDVRWGTSLSTISTEGDNTKNKVWTFLLGLSFN